jgi:hypothetical protein
MKVLFRAAIAVLSVAGAPLAHADRRGTAARRARPRIK